MIVLDTNVISELMKSDPDSRVVDWLDSQSSNEVWTTSINIFEIVFGLESLSDGRRKKNLTEAFLGVLEVDLQERVLEFDLSSGKSAGAISAKLFGLGRPVEVRDVQIAGIVATRNATLATRNLKHFRDCGIALINPWDSK
jgi:toxin FitB